MTIAPFQPHRPDAGAARTPPGRSWQKQIEWHTSPQKTRKPRTESSRTLHWRHSHTTKAILVNSWPAAHKSKQEQETKSKALQAPIGNGRVSFSGIVDEVHGAGTGVGKLGGGERE